MSDSTDFRIELTDWVTSEAELFAVRRTVFIDEQKVPAELEVDEHDLRALHAVARDAQGRAIGTGRLVDDGHVGRLAVLASWRSRGVGRALVLHLLEEAERRGMTETIADAQIAALGFWGKLGFVPEGPEFLDAGIPHRKTRRPIRPTFRSSGPTE
jgi:predicted GNAT family N-acyltransferase